MPAQSQIPSGGFVVTPELYAGRVEIVKARILVGGDALPIATKFEVNARFDGQFFVNARQRPVGALPNGIRWTSGPQGIHFFGVPQQFGTFEALFEGPYPNNFVGTSSTGSYSVDQCHPASQSVSPGIQTALVFGWIVRFVVTPKSANSVSFGSAWRNVLAKVNPALGVYREEWSGGGGGSVSTPSAPLNLQAVAGDQSVALSFNPPLSDGGSPITGYEYHCSLWTTSSGAWAVGTFSGSPLTGAITGLVNSSSYTIRVRAVNSAGPGLTSAAVVVVPSASIFATMRVVGSEAALGNWSVENSAQMTRQGAPAGFDWTVLVNITNPATAKFKFAVGVASPPAPTPWDDPNTPLVENWGELQEPGTVGYFIADPVSGAPDIEFIEAAPAGSQAGQYRFSFNETTYAYAIASGGGVGTGTAPQIQGPNPWSVGVMQGVGFSMTVVASGSPAPSFTATGLPVGLSISLAGVISGTVTGTNSTATITATNSAGSDSRQLSFIVAVRR
jgi:hypothetical protein